MPDVRGLNKKVIPEQKKPSIPKKNTSMMPSFNPEDVFLLPEDKYTSNPNISFSMAPPSIPSAIPPRPASQPMPQLNVIRNAGLQMLPDEPMQPEDDSSNFLASLIAQGVAGIGTGLMGGSPKDIMNSANMFQYMRDQESSRNKAKLLMDPKSEESKKRREVFKKLGYNVPDNFSYTDLNDPTVLQTLKGQMEQSRLATMPKGGGGVGGAGKTSKPEKGTMLEDKDNDELGKINELRNLTNDLANSVKAKGNAWIGGASKEQDTLKYGIAATMGVLKGQGAMTESDVEFWNKSLAISPSETKEEYTSRLKNLQQRLIDKQITKLKNKGFEVEYRDKENKYYVFPKGDSIDPIGEF